MSAAEDRAESVRLIRDSAAAIATSDLARIRTLRFADPGFDPGTWREMCAMGWPGLRVAEHRGGAGLGLVEFCALAEELGTALVPEPLIEAAFAADLLGAHPALAGLLDGSRLILPAWQEHANALDAGDGTRFADGRVSGRKVFIPAASGADAFIVVGRTEAGLVATHAKGVTLAIERTQDGGQFGTLTLDGAAYEAVGPADFTAARDAATLATAAYLLGVMQRAFAITLDYLRTRQQFGRPIGSFQALQHRAADLKIQVELTRASVEAAAQALDDAVTPRQRRAAVSRAKARAAEAAMLVTRQAIQLHGGIGYTDEADIGLYLRKAMVLSNLYGSSALHRRRFMDATEDEA